MNTLKLKIAEYEDTCENMVEKIIFDIAEEKPSERVRSEVELLREIYECIRGKMIINLNIPPSFIENVAI